MAGPYTNSPIHFFESVSADTATPSVEIGTRRREGNDEYIYVYNDGGEQISPSYAARRNLLSSIIVNVDVFIVSFSSSRSNLYARSSRISRNGLEEVNR